jgi:hypothetical protein
VTPSASTTATTCCSVRTRRNCRTAAADGHSAGAAAALRGRVRQEIRRPRDFYGAENTGRRTGVDEDSRQRAQHRGSRGAATTRIDFIGEIKDEYGITIQNIRDSITVRLSDADAQQLARRPIQCENGYVLLPGKYVLKVLARDTTTGRIGTYQTPFVVPNLVREKEQVPISSVVLSSQRVALGDELFTVRQDADVAALNPLVVDGQKLLPSVTRVFSKSRDLLVYLETYQRDTTATAARPVVAVLSLYRGDEKSSRRRRCP